MAVSCDLVWLCLCLCAAAAAAVVLTGFGCVTSSLGPLLNAKPCCCVLVALWLALHFSRLQWCIWVLQNCILRVDTWLRTLLLALDVALLLPHAEKHARLSSCCAEVSCDTSLACLLLEPMSPCVLPLAEKHAHPSSCLCAPGCPVTPALHVCCPRSTYLSRPALICPAFARGCAALFVHPAGCGVLVSACTHQLAACLTIALVSCSTCCLPPTATMLGWHVTYWLVAADSPIPSAQTVTVEINTYSSAAPASQRTTHTAEAGMRQTSHNWQSSEICQARAVETGPPYTVTRHNAA